MCKEDKLKEFYFKLIHRILVSKKQLHLFGVSNNSNCTYCGQPDSISDTFIECHHSKKFFQSVLQHFNKENITSFTQSDEELLFGKSLNTIGQLQRPPLLKKLNYCMLLAKYYLYNQKLNQIEPELNEFKNRLNLNTALRNLYKCSRLLLLFFFVICLFLFLFCHKHSTIPKVLDLQQLNYLTEKKRLQYLQNTTRNDLLKNNTIQYLQLTTYKDLFTIQMQYTHEKKKIIRRPTKGKI